MKVMRIINIKELIYKSALFSLQCLSETWVTAGLHIWRGHSCDKRPLRWGIPTMSFWHRSSVNRPCSSFHSLPTHGLPSSLPDWHAHPVNVKETEPNPQLQGVHHDWVNHAPYQWWVYAWPCDIILANGTLGETAKRRWVVERQFCKRFYLMIQRNSREKKKKTVSFSTKTHISVCGSWTSWGLGNAKRKAKQKKESRSLKISLSSWEPPFLDFLLLERLNFLLFS